MRWGLMWKTTFIKVSLEKNSFYGLRSGCSAGTGETGTVSKYSPEHMSPAERAQVVMLVNTQKDIKNTKMNQWVQMMKVWLCRKSFNLKKLIRWLRQSSVNWTQHFIQCSTLVIPGVMHWMNYHVRTVRSFALQKVQLKWKLWVAR